MTPNRTIFPHLFFVPSKRISTICDFISGISKVKQTILKVKQKIQVNNLLFSVFCPPPVFLFGQAYTHTQNEYIEAKNSEITIHKALALYFVSARERL